MFSKTFVLVLVLASAPVCAQEARKSLAGVGGLEFEEGVPIELAFGSGLASVQERGGSKLKLERRQLSDGRDVNVLSSRMIFRGWRYSISFIFGDADRLSRVNFSDFYYGYCEGHGEKLAAELIALYGQPDTDVIDGKGTSRVRTILMTFGDGAEISVSYSYFPSCFPQISFATAQGKTSNLKRP